MQPRAGEELDTDVG